MNYFSAVLAAASITAASMLSLGAYEPSKVCDEVALSLEEAIMEGILTQEEADTVLDRCITAMTND